MFSLSLDIEGLRHVIVDPPRAGLHPKVARYLADYAADRLIYVACSPAARKGS